MPKGEPVKPTRAEVLDVAGEAGHFRVKVRERTRYVDPEKCTGCGECADVCPVKIDLPGQLLRLRGEAE